MIRKVFLNIILTLMFCAVICTAANADDFSIVVNAPKSGWIVREIPAKSATGVSYCSMRSAYNSGHVLVFARDIKDSNTIAIDFKQAALEAGQQYVVFITVGRVERQVTAVAATPSVLTMRLGRDSALYNALQVNRVATFKIGANDIDFNLFSGMSLGLKTLSKCVTSVKSKAKFKTKNVSVGSDIKNVPKVALKKPKVVKKKAKVVKRKKKKVVARKVKPLRKSKVKPSEKETKAKAKHMSASDKAHQSIIEAIKMHRRKKGGYAAAASSDQGPRSVVKTRRAFSDVMSKRGDDRVSRLMKLEDALLDTPKRSVLQDLSDIKMTKKERLLNRQHIENNKSKIRRLIDENKTLSMENKMVRTRSKEWAVESQRDKNSIREEILALKKDNMQLAMELQNDKDILEAELELMKRRNDALAEESDKKILEARRLAMSANIRQQDIEAETELMRERNRRVELETKLEREEARRRSLESKVTQKKMDQEVSRIRSQNEKLLKRIADLKRIYAGETESETTDVYEELKSSGTYGLKALLYNSGAVGEGYLDVELDPVSEDRYYKWSDKKIYGFAREILNNKDGDIEIVAQDYMEHLEGQCGGDFAKTIGGAKILGNVEFLETEMACMGVEDEVAAAVLFLHQGDKLTIISQEGLPDAMPSILEKRKMVVATLME